MPYPPCVIGIVGPSGSGKSTSLRGLDLATTRIADIEGKGMPFKVVDSSNVFTPTTIDQFRAWFNKQASDKITNLIVIDSATSLIDMLQAECEMSYKGYDIWKYYNDGIGSLWSLFKRSKKCVVFTSLDEIVQMPTTEGTIATQRRCFVQGKEWANKGLESECIAVWTAFGKRKAGGAEGVDYFFNTQTDGITKAKTPMFWKLPYQMGNNVKTILDLVEKNLGIV